MQIETYEIEEVQGEAGNMAADVESIEIIQRLGLTGQQSLSNTETLDRFPYRHMTPLESKVFALVFPVRDKLEEYRGGIIPLRVLQVAAYCKEQKIKRLDSIRVWHTGIAKEDPILVGHTSSYGGEFFLLARWGDALESFEKLTEKAKKLWIAKATSRIRREVAEWNQAMTSLDDAADELFLSGKISDGVKRYELEAL